MIGKPAILKKSSNKWMNSGKPLTQHLKGTIFAFPCLPRQCRDSSQVRWENKSPFDSILSQQRLCQKLPKSVDVRWKL